MLHKPDVNVSKIMELADYIENEFIGFWMRRWDSCICGAAHRMLDRSTLFADWRDIAKELAISDETAIKLFGVVPTGVELTPHEAMVYRKTMDGLDRHKAARGLRYLATTGEFPGWERFA